MCREVFRELWLLFFMYGANEDFLTRQGLMNPLLGGGWTATMAEGPCVSALTRYSRA